MTDSITESVLNQHSTIKPIERMADYVIIIGEQLIVNFIRYNCTYFSRRSVINHAKNNPGNPHNPFLFNKVLTQYLAGYETSGQVR